MGDALKRRCLHLYIPFPDEKMERRIVAARVPAAAESLRKQLVAFVHALRAEELKKVPAISETIDWARTLLLLNVSELDVETVRRTINVLLKFQEDVEAVDRQLYKFVKQAKEAV
jgi:MoxR-like ATPase